MTFPCSGAVAWFKPLPTFFIATCVVVFLFLSADSHAITIRHDVNDAVYTSLSSQPQFAATGAVMTPFNWCTANLVHPEWALSANHCVNSNNPAAFTFVMGADRNNPTLTRTSNAITKNPAFNINAAEQGGDFGLYRLSEPVLTVTPARLYRGGTPETGREVTVVGYGFTGTGLTGQDNNLPVGIRRASTNNLDAFGNAVGWSSQLLLTDFDNPSNPGDNSLGSTAVTSTEGAVALYDSGAGWYQQINGVWYLTGITSFRADSDGNSNSDYGDVSAAGRVSDTHRTWIETNHDRSLFWNVGAGDWSSTANWYGGVEPGSTNAAVIDSGTATISAAGETAKYTFVAGSGILQLRNHLTTNYLIVRDNARVQFGATTAAISLNGILQHETGILSFEIGGLGAGNFDSLAVNNTALLSGTIEINTLAGYGGPISRGTIDEFTLITATSITNQLDAVRYNGALLNAGLQFVGSTSAGLSGLFRELVVDGTSLSVSNYLALPGDANGDGNVDGTDFGIWNSNKFRTGTTWVTGDFNGDGNTDGSDFGIWNTNKFTSVVRASTAVRQVPEPAASSAILMSLVTAVIVRRRLVSGRRVRG
jgi:Trypsin